MRKSIANQTKSSGGLGGASSLAVGFSICIIADDLTGACDTGAPFAQRGLKTTVLWRGDVDLLEGCATVTVFCTNSRGSEPIAAAGKVADAWRILEPLRPAIVYKKIDSALRGNIGAEIDAVLTATGRSHAIVAPSFPGIGRVLSGGVLRSSNHLDEEVNLIALLQRQSGRCLSHIRSDALATTPAKFTERLKLEIEGGNELIVVDSERDSDLAVIASAAFMLTPIPVLIGSAGLARQLAATIGTLLEPRLARQQVSENCRSTSVLFIVGSRNPTTQAQLHTLSIQSPGRQFALDGAAASKARGAFEAGLPLAIEVGWQGGNEDVHLLEVLVEAARCRPRALVLSGGDTAHCVCEAAEVRKIRLESEIEPGIALGYCRGGAFNGLPIVTKSGGFGSPEAFCKIIQYLRHAL